MSRYKWVEPPLRLHDQQPHRAKKTLLDLPAELGNAVYELVVVIPKHLINITAPQPPLTHVCRQTRFECLTIYMQCNKFQANLTSVTSTSNLSKWVKQLGSKHGSHIEGLAIKFSHIKLDNLYNIMQTWDDLLWSIKLAKINPEALRWWVSDFRSCIFNNRSMQVQLFFDNIHGPLLVQYELNRSAFSPGATLYAQKIRYRKRDLMLNPWKSSEDREQGELRAVTAYIDKMYEAAPDAYSWLEYHQQLVLKDHPIMQARVIGLEKQMAWMLTRQQSGIYVEPSSVFNMQKHLSRAKGKLAELETRYRNWTATGVDTDRLAQAVSQMDVSARQSAHDDDGMTRDEYHDRRMAEIAEGERSFECR